MSFKPLAKIPPLRWALYRLAWWRTGEKIEEIVPHLRPNDRVLDVGAGNCVLCQRLHARGYQVVPLDLANLRFIDEIRPVVYDGVKIPFGDGEFDAALVITVLHHIPDPDAALAEIARTARRLIVIEEIYDSAFVKYYTYAIDSLFNLEFFGHPRSNRTDAGWPRPLSAWA
jgi:2-polyprenyl-3-methyl-5-hydroxy-6-metoxy-1,4-benzoquinol methylase